MKLFITLALVFGLSGGVILLANKWEESNASLRGSNKSKELLVPKCTPSASVNSLMDCKNLFVYVVKPTKAFVKTKNGYTGYNLPKDLQPSEIRYLIVHMDEHWYYGYEEDSKKSEQFKIPIEDSEVAKIYGM